MSSRDVAKALTKAGCTWRSGKGDHVRWTCPCGKHHATVITAGVVSPGVLRRTIQDLECLPKGWLQ